MARKANLIVENLREQELSYESVGVGDYIKATEDLKAMHFSFKDVQMLLFKPKLNVLVNLAALHYCIMQLNLPVSTIMIFIFLSQSYKHSLSDILCPSFDLHCSVIVGFHCCRIFFNKINSYGQFLRVAKSWRRSEFIEPYHPFECNSHPATLKIRSLFLTEKGLVKLISFHVGTLLQNRLI